MNLPTCLAETVGGCTHHGEHRYIHECTREHGHDGLHECGCGCVWGDTDS